ncbi:MAG TPA: 1-(5-phosphoribosyl)-5-[(5-phosphoribosylamino)methylideneamino]imidazole-4-carboxamide isomerase [Planctomycetes bacterium]|nr:1-(5-phosphoribosyl)-5-[(5-phosphoribosylamino)methylideneamino]imidazole-4-carboxamide isomerase [Planctomycetota bacterium]
MDVIPAIDLIDGKCVRLIQGDYHRQISYEPDPVKQALEFLADGASRLHIVDLDGARVGKPVNLAAIEAITTAVDLKVEVGGGIRDEASISKLLHIGVDRVIVGTSAVDRFDWFGEMAEKFAGKLVLGLDARGSKVAIQGWAKDSHEQLLQFAAQAAKLPLSAIIYTDITKDGMLSGPNFERTKALVEAVDIPVIAAGGVTTVENVEKLSLLGAGGAIIGRALYEGSITLSDAIAAARSVGQA